MLRCLLDGHARTDRELARAGGVGVFAADAQLAILAERGLVRVVAQGRHRYFGLHDDGVAASLRVSGAVADAARREFTPSTPLRLRDARTCYDHIAGVWAVALHDRLFALHWLSHASVVDGSMYEVTKNGDRMLRRLGVDVAVARARHRRFAWGCLDWSERRPHLAGALGAALLDMVLRRQWVVREPQSRALGLTSAGGRALRRHFGVMV